MLIALSNSCPHIEHLSRRFIMPLSSQYESTIRLTIFFLHSIQPVLIVARQEPPLTSLIRFTRDVIMCFHRNSGRAYVR